MAHVAARAGHASAVEKLLALGADVNSKSKQWDTPLHEAVIDRHIEIAETLIRAGANVNAESSIGTPLDWTCPGSEMEGLLLRHGATLRVKNWGKNKAAKESGKPAVGNH